VNRGHEGKATAEGSREVRGPEVDHRGAILQLVARGGIKQHTTVWSQPALVRL